jgi:signal transduction histidine kinase
MTRALHRSISTLRGFAPPWADPEGVLAPPASRGRSIGFLVVLALAVVGGMVATSLLLAAGSDYLADDPATTLYATYLAAAPVLIGLVWRIRRPESTVGPLLVLFGLSAWTQALQAADDAVLFSIGVVVGQSAVTAWTFYLALAFPVGRLQGRFDRLAMALVSLSILAYLVWVSQASTLVAGPIAECFVVCPPNPFQVGESSWLQAVAGNFSLLAGAAAAIGAFGIIGWRLNASRSRWRTSLPVALTSFLFVGMLGTFHVWRTAITANGTLDDVISWALVATAIAFPIAFLVHLVRTEFAGQAVVGRLMDKLVSADRGTWRDALAEALGDPRLRLATWDSRTGSYRDACGCHVEPSEHEGDHSWIEVRRGDEPVAAILADQGILQDPRIVATAANATLVATELNRTHEQVDSLRDAVSQAAQEARVELSRDLHDSAQQRLVALRIHVGLARERLDAPEERRVLDAIGSEVEAALADIRAVAHLDGPRHLRFGLPVALRHATRASGIPVRVDADLVPRLDPDVERAVYYTCLEAVQNAAKHAGAGASVRVRLAVTQDGLEFAVTDEGRGFAVEAASGAGLEIMRARMRAAGGTLRIDSRPGQGTSVLGLVPFGGPGG